jgi:hypothetical protein
MVSFDLVVSGLSRGVLSGIYHARKLLRRALLAKPVAKLYRFIGAEKSI